jgi:integrase
MQEGRGAISSIELSADEMKNRLELAYDVPPSVAKMLIEYRDRIAPKVIGHRPMRLFVTAKDKAKNQATVAHLITSWMHRRAGIVLTPHQFRHLSAKVILDADHGAFETVRQNLGHKNSKTTTAFYAGIDSRRAARRHHQLIQKALETQMPQRRSKSRRS